MCLFGCLLQLLLFCLFFFIIVTVRSSGFCFSICFCDLVLYLCLIWHIMHSHQLYKMKFLTVLQFCLCSSFFDQLLMGIVFLSKKAILSPTGRKTNKQKFEIEDSVFKCSIDFIWILNLLQTSSWLARLDCGKHCQI